MSDNHSDSDPISICSQGLLNFVRLILVIENLSLLRLTHRVCLISNVAKAKDLSLRPISGSNC